MEIVEEIIKKRIRIIKKKGVLQIAKRWKVKVKGQNIIKYKKLVKKKCLRINVNTV